MHVAIHAGTFNPPFEILLLALLVLTVLGVAAARSLVVAQPDEWLLCIRNGRLVKAGVGIYLSKAASHAAGRPGDDGLS